LGKKLGKLAEQRFLTVYNMGIAIKTDLDRAAPSENPEAYHDRQSSRSEPWDEKVLHVLPHDPMTLTKSGKGTTVQD
jgi:hypothetical protein